MRVQHFCTPKHNVAHFFFFNRKKHEYGGAVATSLILTKMPFEQLNERTYLLYVVFFFLSFIELLFIRLFLCFCFFSALPLTRGWYKVSASINLQTQTIELCANKMWIFVLLVIIWLKKKCCAEWKRWNTPHLHGVLLWQAKTRWNETIFRHFFPSKIWTTLLHK